MKRSTKNSAAASRKVARTAASPTIPAWLGPALHYVLQWLGYQERLTQLPGLSFAIAHDGELLHAEAFGVANQRTGERLTSRHRFRVASHSKTFTSVGIMRLVEAGHVRLDDAVGAYIDGLDAELAGASIAQLLSHNAGVIRDGEDGGQWADRRPFLNEQELRAALARPQPIEANVRMKYSNHGFGLLGLVIAKVTGTPYNEWIAREVVAPAGLAHTTPDFDAPGKTRRPAPFTRGHTGRVLLGERLVIPGDNSTHALASATGFVSTATDLVRFFAQLAPASPSTLLSVRSRRELMRRHWRVPDSSLEQNYGLGLAHGVVRDGSGGWPWFGHSGGFQGYLTQTAVLPERKLALSILTNAADAAPALLFEGVVRILQTFARHGPPEPNLTDWQGRYWSLWGASDLVAIGNRVFVASPGLAQPLADATELEVTGPDEAKIVRAVGYGNFGERAQLLRGRNGKVTGVQLAPGLLLPEAQLARELRKRYGASGSTKGFAQR